MAFSLTVKVESPGRRKSARARANLRLNVTRIAEVRGVVGGEAVRKRVAVQGQPVDKPRRWVSKPGKLFLVAERYANEVGFPTNERNTRRGVVMFRGGWAAFHAKIGTKLGTFNNQDEGMWSGHTVRRTGKGQAVENFRGRSLGGAPFGGATAAARSRKFERWKDGGRVRGIKTGNAKKALRVGRRLGTHVLEKTRRERASMGEGVAWVLSSWVHRTMSGEQASGRPTGLGAEIVRRMRT